VIAVWSKDGTSPYLIQLDNDFASIGTNAEGGGYTAELLQTVSTVNVTVYEGNTNITSNCSFGWTVSGGTLNSTTGTNNYFKTLTADTAFATVTVKKGSTTLGSKQFTISKNKQGK
jgi:hypothetical protein